jgi:hypothetical protein
VTPARRLAPVLALLAAVEVTTALAPPRAPAAPGDEGEPAPVSTAAAALLREVGDLLDGYTSEADEARIVALLRGAPGPVLDEVVRRADLDELLEDVDDHPGGPQHEAALLAVLTRERVEALSIAARAALVTALQRGRTSDEEERAARDVLLRTHGAALTALKCALDASGDHHDLEALVYHDIDDAQVREALLAHFAREAIAAPTSEVKVCSDIDDTLYCNWVDERYPPKTVYPGVRALYRELDVGPDERGREGDLVFVTARPFDPAGLIEDETRDTLRGLGVRGVVMTGSLTNLTSDASIAAGKLEALARLRALFPEYGVVFLGDSGQGDALVAERLVADERATTRAVFIHDVVPTLPEGRAAWAAKGVPFFDTYAGAALAAFDAGLIGRAGLARVLRAAQVDLDAIAFPEARTRAARQGELDRDVEAADARLPEGERVRRAR